MNEYSTANPYFENCYLHIPFSKSLGYQEAIKIISLIDKKDIETIVDKRGQVTEHKIKLTLANIQEFNFLLLKVYFLKYSKIYSNGIELRPYYYRGFCDCFVEKGINSKYCYGIDNKTVVYPNERSFENPFGCVFLPDSSLDRGWYTYGKYPSVHEWMIDKDALRFKIKNHISLCPLYDVKKALDHLDKLPSLINTQIDKDWLKFEIIDAFSNIRYAVMPKLVKGDLFGDAPYFAPFHEWTLNNIIEAINNEEISAAKGYREKDELYFHIIVSPDSCENCKDNAKGKIFSGKEILKNWEKYRILPVPHHKCQNEKCRCVLMPFLELYWIDEEGKVRIKFENPDEYEKWRNENKLPIKNKRSLLKELSENERTQIKNLNFKIIIDKEKWTSKNEIKEFCIKLGESKLNNLRSVNFMGFSTTKIVDEIVNKYTPEEYKRLLLENGLNYFAELLKRIKYEGENPDKLTQLKDITIKKSIFNNSISFIFYTDEHIDFQN